jgi:hypothetical protein
MCRPADSTEKLALVKTISAALGVLWFPLVVAPFVVLLLIEESAFSSAARKLLMRLKLA